ncbi:MAG: hypothetical protein GF320_11830 [Armatimonadia bacterium]|nr:hypothetical protein [Armatimonadia bacterium]
MIWAYPHIIDQSPMSADERAMLGEYGPLAPDAPIPHFDQSQPAVAEWPGGARDAVWPVSTEVGTAYVTPWLEVLAGVEPTLHSEEGDAIAHALGEWSQRFENPSDAPRMAYGGYDAGDWGLGTAESAAAMAAVLSARLGRGEEAASWAARAGRAGFEQLPAALAFRAHRTALEGQTWGLDRRVSVRLLDQAMELAGDYAGRDRLEADRAVMRETARQDRVPPAWGEDEPEHTLPWARYQMWRLRDAGMPQGMDYTHGDGDPMVRLLTGGEYVPAAAMEMLDTDAFTRVLAEDSDGPVPDLLRIGDLAYELLSMKVGRHHLESRGVSRYFALDHEEREAVAEELAEEAGLGLE